MSRRLRIRLAALAIVLGAASQASAAPLASLRLDPDQIAGLAKTGPGAGSSGAAGTRTTVLAGDPARPGPYTIVLTVPAHTEIGAHSHRDDRSAVVISGNWWFGYGDKADPKGLRRLPPGSFYTEPAGRTHFARTDDTPVTVYITGIGPTDTRYVDAKADPRR